LEQYIVLFLKILFPTKTQSSAPLVLVSRYLTAMRQSIMCRAQEPSL